MGETVQLYGGIYEVNFGYNTKMEVYANSSSDIPELYAIMSKRLQERVAKLKKVAIRTHITCELVKETKRF